MLTKSLRRARTPFRQQSTCDRTVPLSRSRASRRQKHRGVDRADGRRPPLCDADPPQRGAARAKTEWTSPDELAYFDESKENLKLRLRKLQSGAAWAEEPPSHTRHLITNVRASAAGQGEYLVRSNFLAYRSRSERQTDYLVGERNDRLRCVDTDAGFQIVSRRILLDQTTFLANNLSFFL